MFKQKSKGIPRPARLLHTSTTVYAPAALHAKCDRLATGLHRRQRFARVRVCAQTMCLPADQLAKHAALRVLARRDFLPFLLHHTLNSQLSTDIPTRLLNKPQHAQRVTAMSKRTFTMVDNVPDAYADFMEVNSGHEFVSTLTRRVSSIAN
jgi:hypothetical protein